jgi:tetratricopeptide (TPR) repeat protein
MTAKLAKEGNVHFGNKDYGNAFRCYTSALDFANTDNLVSSLACNNAATLLRLHGEKSFTVESAIAFSFSASIIDPSYEKARLRSAAAFDACHQEDLANLCRRGPSCGVRCHDEAVIYGVSDKLDVCYRELVNKYNNESQDVDKDRCKEVTTELKARGNEHFKVGDFLTACSCYTKALKITAKSQGVAILLSSRSACYLSTSCPLEALENAIAAIVFDPSFFKGHYRRACALMELGQHERAAAAVEIGLRLNPSEATLLELKNRLAIEVKAGKKTGSLKSTRAHEAFMRERLSRAEVPENSQPRNKAAANDDTAASLDTQLQMMTLMATMAEKVGGKSVNDTMLNVLDLRAPPFHSDFARLGLWPAQVP